MSGFTDLFGGGTLQAADVSFAAIPLTGNLVTFWPPAAVGTDQALPRLADVTATGAGFTLYLPDATAVSAGQDLFCFNAGAYSFTVADYSGAALAVIAPGAQRYFYLVDNSTAGGTWRTILMGVGAASNDASQLAGLGLKAIGASLNQAAEVSLLSTDTIFTAGARGKVFVNTGGAVTGTLPLTVAVNVGQDFFLELRNQGSGALTVAPTGGELIDGSASLTLNINESCFVHSGTGAWYTVGRGRNAQFNFTQLVKAVTGGSDVLSLSEAANVVQTYTGVLTSNEVVTLPSVVQVYYVSNQTTGAFTFTLQTAGGGATLAVPSGQNAVVFSDGTNVINASTSISGISTLLLYLGSVGAPSLGLGASNNGLFGPSTTTVAVSAGGVEPIRWNASGQSLAADGAAALPAYSFNASPSTGVFAPAADSLGFATAGVEHLRVASNGFFGFYTTNPKAPLQFVTYGGLDGNPNQFIIRNNVYFSGSSKYMMNGFATEIDMNQSDGSIKFYSAPTGLADAAATLSLRLVLNVGGDLVPGADNAQDLGSVGSRWATVYGVNFSGNAASATTAGSAITASSATYATTAGSAITASSATYATTAGALSATLPIAGGGTGATTAAAARAALGSTTVGDAVFVATSQAAAQAALGVGASNNYLVTNVTALRAVAKVAGAGVRTMGYYTEGDGGTGFYRYDSTDTTSADNGGSIIVASDGGRWKLTQEYPQSLKQWGAKGDGATDDTARIQAALDFIASPGGALFVDYGTFKITSLLSWGNDCLLFGIGLNSAIKGASLTTPLFQSKGTSLSRRYRLQMRDMAIDNTSSAAAGGIGVDLRNATDCILRNVFFSNVEVGVQHFADTGLGCYYNLVEKCTFTSCVNGLTYSTLANENIAFGCRTNNCTYPVVLNDGSHNHLKDLALELFTTAITISGPAYNTQITSPRLENVGGVGTGINITGAAVQTSIKDPQFISLATDFSDTGGIGTLLNGRQRVTATLNFGTVAANSTSDLAVAITGATTTDSVRVTPPSTLPAGLICIGVPSTGQHYVRMSNVTGAGVAAGNVVYTLDIQRRE